MRRGRRNDGYSASRKVLGDHADLYEQRMSLRARCDGVARDDEALNVEIVVR